MNNDTLSMQMVCRIEKRMDRPQLQLTSHYLQVQQVQQEDTFYKVYGKCPASHLTRIEDTCVD